MAHPIQSTGINPVRYVAPSSRYMNSEVISYGEQGILTFTTYKRQDAEFGKDDRFMIIPPGEEYRPDKTSYRAYGTVDFWWKIMEMNNIFDIFNYKAGTNIRLPSILRVL